MVTGAFGVNGQAVRSPAMVVAQRQDHVTSLNQPQTGSAKDQTGNMFCAIMGWSNAKVHA